MAKRSNLPTLDDLLRVIPMGCATCGSQSRAYPYPTGRGSLFCPKCSPAWLEPFLKHMLATAKAEGKVL